MVIIKSDGKNAFKIEKNIIANSKRNHVISINRNTLFIGASFSGTKRSQRFAQRIFVAEIKEDIPLNRYR